MKKSLLIAAIFIGFLSLVANTDSVEASANISPGNQTIYGSYTPADWSFTWSGTAPFVVYFREDTNVSYRVIDPNTRNHAMSHRYWYSLPAHSSGTTWNPSIQVVSQNGSLSSAVARVTQIRRE